MKNHIRYTIAFIGWCIRKLFGSTIDNINSKHEWFYRQLQRDTFLTTMLWFFATLLACAAFGLALLCVTEDKVIAWLLIRGFFWLSFGYMMMGHLTNALRAFEREREDLMDILRDEK